MTTSRRVIASSSAGQTPLGELPALTVREGDFVCLHRSVEDGDAPAQFVRAIRETQPDVGASVTLAAVAGQLDLSLAEYLAISDIRARTEGSQPSGSKTPLMLNQLGLGARMLIGLLAARAVADIVVFTTDGLDPTWAEAMLKLASGLVGGGAMIHLSWTSRPCDAARYARCVG